jgi:hypothetical protein
MSTYRLNADYVTDLSKQAAVLLGAAMAGLYHLLPRPRPGHPFRAALLVLGGFILAQTGLSVAISGLGLVPKGPFYDLLHQLTDYVKGYQMPARHLAVGRAPRAGV